MQRKNFKLLASLLSLVAVLILVSCNAGTNQNGQETGESSSTSEKDEEIDERVRLSRIYKFAELDPSSYEFYDYADHAIELDALMFNLDAEGDYLPLVWQDETNNTFGMAAYVGDPRHGNDGAQEAVTTMASVLSATLVGIDKSNQNGINYVEQIIPYFNEAEQTVLNNINGSSAETSMWYHIYPSIVYVQLSILYPEETILRENALATIESWYEAAMIMAPDGEDANFNHTGFDFSIMQPYQNGIWTEPDSATGIAYLMDLGYSLTGEDKYLDALERSLNYIEEFFGGPLYEVLQYYGPYLNAKYNALDNKEYDMKKSFGRIFDGASIPRGGWGVIHEQWGDYDISGLFGSTTDRGGYAFAMNTFAGVDALIPTVKYDNTYANAIGEFVLRVTKNSANYFANNTEEDRQSTKNLGLNVDSRIKELVPYEGIINSHNGQTPWFGGDPTINDWAETDFSLYSASHIGVMGHRISETNVQAILKIDLNEMSALEQLPTNLLYNPYTENKTVVYEVTSDEEVQLFDAISQEIITNTSESAEIEIQAGESLVIVEIPVDKEVTEQDGILKVDDIFIAQANE